MMDNELTDRILIVTNDGSLRELIRKHLAENGIITGISNYEPEVLMNEMAILCTMIFIDHKDLPEGFNDCYQALRTVNQQMAAVHILDDAGKEPALPMGDLDDFLYGTEIGPSCLRLLHIIRRVQKLNGIAQHIQRHIDEFLSIFNCLDMGIYVVDPQTYSILAANSSAIKILGLNPVGRKCYEALLKEQPGPCNHCDNELLARGILQYGSMPWEFKSAHTDRWYRCISKILAWSENKYAKMEIIVDITETKRVERELDVLRVFRDKVKTLSHVPVMSFDKKGKIGYTNVACCNFLGLSESEISGQFVWKFLDEQGKESWFRLLDEVSMKDSESIECGIYTKEKKAESWINIIFDRDTKGTILDGMLFIIEKPRKDFVRFY